MDYEESSRENTAMIRPPLRLTDHSHLDLSQLNGVW